MKLTQDERLFLARVFHAKAKQARQPENKKKRPAWCKTVVKLSYRFKDEQDNKPFSRAELRILEEVVDKQLVLLMTVVIPEYQKRIEKFPEKAAHYIAHLEEQQRAVPMVQALKEKVRGAL